MFWDKHLDFMAHLRRFQAEESSTVLQTQIASKARPGLLILYHQFVNGIAEAELLRELKGDTTGWWSPGVIGMSIEIAPACCMLYALCRT